ncbi:hypothetical protein FRC01_012957 [Tulasnella sp. 417]|nr:hypothetical protein FRC01_012957 [Tulasnella sp. 417]
MPVQRARSVVLEGIDEDPKFTLSVAMEREGNIKDFNTNLELEYDDDTALSAGDLVAVHTDGEIEGVQEDGDEGGGVLMPLDPEEEELTDHDADGETDLEYGPTGASSKSTSKFNNLEGSSSADESENDSDDQWEGIQESGDLDVSQEWEESGVSDIEDDGGEDVELLSGPLTGTQTSSRGNRDFVGGRVG